MNVLIATLTVLLAAAAADTSRPSYTLQQYMAIKRSNDPRFAPDGDRITFASNASGDWQLWVTPTSRWQPRQVTHLAGGVIALWSPAGKSLLAMADRNGDQKYQLYMLDVESGETTLVTHEPGAQHRLGGWMPDGKSIFYTSNVRDPRYIDCYVMDLGTKQAERVFDGAGILHAITASHDGRSLLAESIRSNVDSDILLIDVRTKSARSLTPHQGDTQFSVIGFSGDDRTVYCRANAGGEYLGILSIDIASGVRRELIPASHDVDYAVIDRQGSRIAFSENVDGFERLSVLNVHTARREPLPVLPEGINTPQEFSADGSKLAIVVSTPVHDDEVWVIDLRARRASRVTYSPQGDVAEDSYVLPKTIHYRTFDGRSIPALLFVPPAATPKHPAPVIVSVHGGPEGQEQPYLTNYYQFLVARGYAVLATNVRGSTGYGKTFVALDDGPLRWDALKDVEYGMRWVRQQPNLDAGKAACFGASYGGF